MNRGTLSHPRCPIFTLTILTFLAAAGPASAAIYNNADDFSHTTNPAGVWTYGSMTPAGVFSPYLTPNPSIPGATSFGGWGTYPHVVHNTSSSTAQSGTVKLAGNQAAFHPDNFGNLSVYRFLAPSAGSYLLEANFSSADTHGATTDIHVLNNGTSLFDGIINGVGSTQSFSTTLTLGVGDHIDFTVGKGSNNYFNDTTGLDATLTSATVPEPTTLAIWSLLGGIGLVFGHRRRKRKAA